MHISAELEGPNSGVESVRDLLNLPRGVIALRMSMFRRTCGVNVDGWMIGGVHRGHDLWEV